MTELTPQTVVAELDKYIVGQQEAKRAVAIALVNRERRKLLSPQIKKEVLPKNILLIGPTGVGKTEIARRLATMTQAPFIKVEATRFTEVGYVGRDTESIIHELADVSFNMIYEARFKEVERNAEGLATNKLLDFLCKAEPLEPRRPRGHGAAPHARHPERAETQSPPAVQTRRRYARLLAQHKLDDRMVEIELENDDGWHPQLAGTGMSEEGQDIEEHAAPRPRYRTRRVSVREARRLLVRQEANKLMDLDEIVDQAAEKAQETGIVFIDELDKLTGPQIDVGPDVSGEGVQRDLLPIVEGTTVYTRIGPIKTEHMLFIAAGTFHKSKPSDLIPELQGRFPLRVELGSLSKEDFCRILVEPDNSLVKQYQALLGTEEVQLEFAPEGIEAIAQVAADLNERTENIGARRLHTVVEKVLEDLSFNARDYKGQKVVVDRAYVEGRVSSLLKVEDLGRYIV